MDGDRRTPPNRGGAPAPTPATVLVEARAPAGHLCVRGDTVNTKPANQPGAGTGVCG